MTVLANLETLISQKGPLPFDRIEFEYVAKYGPVSVKTLRKTLSQLYVTGRIEKPELGIYKRPIVTGEQREKFLRGVKA